MKNYSHSTIGSDILVIHHASLYTRNSGRHYLSVLNGLTIQYEEAGKDPTVIGRVGEFQEHQIGDNLIEGKGNIYLDLKNPAVINVLNSLDGLILNPVSVWAGGTAYKITHWRVYAPTTIFVLNILEPKVLNLEGVKLLLNDWRQGKQEVQLSDAKNLKVENIDDTAGKYYPEASKSVPHHRGSVSWAKKRSQTDRNKPFFRVNDVEYTEAQIINIVQFWQAFEGLQASLGTTPSGTIKN